MGKLGTVLIALAVCISLATAASFSYEDCGSSKKIYTINDASMSPDPAIQGKDVTVTADGTLSGTINGGSWSVTIKFGILPVKTVTGDTCDILKDCPCPCSTKDTSVAVTIPVDSFAPNGDYTGTFTAKNGDSSEVGCISFKFHMGASSIDSLDAELFWKHYLTNSTSN
uniref:MD-2-related lipid-recognition domain-containing protein n=1 Tax=Stereomyxa ramosa TaxID=1078864 RepID=A0A7S2ABW4_9EUKA|eukprot:CAMPEP_0174251956 /NCGR_PEP_ID=MMETSP0439-20130205/1622_1 /TAXON_ID=0 /ORGANISM="Stereomyxa ramosa, Strain Chinc5" /LENGTH=168 /DNA_ID=CAMNT_0015332413 /DNA_START=78 /DNA_END=584 /DNA_ORIENTATION=+